MIIQDISEEEFPDTSFSLEEKGKEFAWIYNSLGDAEYSIMWDGHVHFSSLEDGVLYVLPKLLGLKDFRLETSWYFIKRELTFFDNGIFPQGQHTMNMFGNFCAPSHSKGKDDEFLLASYFARYDVQLINSKGALDYTFTAENSEYFDRPPGIAIKQPISQGFNGELLEFIVGTHSDFSVVRDLDLNECSATIGEFLKDR